MGRYSNPLFSLSLADPLSRGEVVWKRYSKNAGFGFLSLIFTLAKTLMRTRRHRRSHKKQQFNCRGENYRSHHLVLINMRVTQTAVNALACTLGIHSSSSSAAAARERNWSRELQLSMPLSTNEDERGRGERRKKKLEEIAARRNYFEEERRYHR